MLKLLFAFALVLPLVGCQQTTQGTPLTTQVTPLTWQWQLSSPPQSTALLPVRLYDVDLFDTPVATIRAMKARGIKVICYFSAGSYEAWRPDAKALPLAARGKRMSGWDERWLDTGSAGVRRAMTARLDLANRKSCTGVEPDNIDGYTNNTGFRLTAATQLEYNRFLAKQAHTRQLTIALKNDVGQVRALAASFDFALNEQCYQYSECSDYAAFVGLGKPVLIVEYQTIKPFCSWAKAAGFVLMQKRLTLDAWRKTCARG